jgi:hypothetical protein
VFEAQQEHPEQLRELRKGYAIDTIDGKDFYWGRIIVPDHDELKREILRYYHDHQLAGHPGITNTVITVA